MRAAVSPHAAARSEPSGTYPARRPDLMAPRFPFASHIPQASAVGNQISCKLLISLGGEVVVHPPGEINALPKGAGENTALRRNGDFESSPHGEVAHARAT